MIDRAEFLSDFRNRLSEVIAHSGLSRQDFAAAAQIDRSTLSQLLSPTNRRLPRLETITAIAQSRQASIDWLLGLSQQGPLSAEVLRQELTLTPKDLAPDDEQLVAWFTEAAGYRVRLVPSTLPDLVKTQDVIRHEVGDFTTVHSEQRIETVATRLAWTRQADTEMECCSSRQSLELFARGEGIWRDLALPARLAQLDQMIELTEELYPAFRWFLFDGLQRYAAPITIFGPKRVSLYLGQMYLVLTSTEHIRVLSAQFDDLIRGAVVQPNEIPKHLRELHAMARRRGR
jgi:transcriptional regulator with XRE-family HTH domain